MDKHLGNMKGYDMNKKREMDYWFALTASICLGIYGVDRFFIGNKKLGVLKLLTLGGFGIWWLIDIFLFATKRINKDIEFTTSKKSKQTGISTLIIVGVLLICRSYFVSPDPIPQSKSESIQEESIKQKELEKESSIKQEELKIDDNIIGIPEEK